VDTFLDSSVLLDILTKDARWYEWSFEAFSSAVDAGRVVINAVVFAEASVRFSRIEDFTAVLDPASFIYHEIPKEAAFLAGKCYLKYRRSGGTRTAPLPDFFIGAHAAVLGLPLLTRDPRRFRKYFPSLDIVSP
jgi:predicted nucleic acid-binding protein